MPTAAATAIATNTTAANTTTVNFCLTSQQLKSYCNVTLHYANSPIWRLLP